MLFSTVLKMKLESYLQKVGTALSLSAAIIDHKDKLILKNDLFVLDDFDISGENKNWVREKIVSQSELYYFVAKSLNGIPSDSLKNSLALITENIQIFIQQEIEAQDLAQEVLGKYEELNLLYDMIRELSTIFDENKICRVTLERAMKVIDVASGAIALKDSRDGELKHVCSGENDQSQKCNNTQPLLELAEQTISAGKEILFDDQRRLPEKFYNSLKNKELTATLCVPIHIGENIGGVLILIGKKNGEVFTSGDIKLLDAIAGYAGITINSNRMVEQMRIAEALQHEMQLARNIQQSLLPTETPENSFFEIAGTCLPAADVGGDFYSYIQLNENCWGLTIADVSGHGVGAALTMASLRSILRSEWRGKFSPEKTVQNANLLMCEDTKDTGMYATLFLANYCLDSQKLYYTNAGHTTPMVWKKEENRFGLLAEGGMPVGMFSEEVYEHGSMQLETDDIVVIYTDGVTEARNEAEQLYDELRLKKVIEKNSQKSAKEVLNAILKSVENFQGDADQRDDITVLVFKVKGKM